MAKAYYKLEIQCPCTRPRCLGKISKPDPKLGIFGNQISRTDLGPTSQRTLQTIAERTDRPEESMARIRATDYLDTTAEQYATVANELLVFRQQRQARLAEQLRLMGAVPDVAFDAQVVRGMVGGRNSAVVCGGGSWRRGLSWTRERRRNETDSAKADEAMAVIDDDAETSRELRSSDSSESVIRTFDSIAEKILTGSACDTMPYAPPPLESVEPPCCRI